MAKDNSITINNWQEGVAKSRYTGFEMMSCVDISEDGVLKINTKTAADTETDAINKTLYWFDQGRIDASASPAQLFGVGSEVGYNYDSGWNSFSNSSTAEGMICFSGSNASKGYMIATDGTNLDSYDCDTPATHDYDFASATGNLQDVTWHPMIEAQNGKIYIGNGRFVSELEEVSGQTFNPGNTATFNLTLEALDLPSDYIVKTIEELGSYLVIGTYSSIRANRGDLFIWDKVSDSFDRVLRINNVDGINQLITYKNLTYIQAGNRGEWFVTDGSSVTKLGELPQPSTTKLNLTFNPGAVGILNDEIIFGVSVDVVSTGEGYGGIWSINPTTGRTKRIHVLSSGETGLNNTVEIGALMVLSAGQIIYSFADTENSTFGVDRTSLTDLYSGSEPYVITPFYRVGSHLNKRTFRKSLTQLAKSLDANETVTITYRTERDGGWTSYLLMTSGQSMEGVAIPSVENIQFKIAPSAAGSVTLTTGPELLEFKVE